MQMPVLGCTFLTLSDREESTAENRQLSEQGSAPIIRVTDHQCPDDRCPPVPHTSSAHLCPAMRPPVPSNAPTCAQQCAHLCPTVRPPVPNSAPTCAQQCAHLCPAMHPPVP
ncbi:unnamed protein product, partial [Staurois parvus]